MAVFKCLTSGNLVTFMAEVDIESMKDHPGYVRVDDEPKVESETPLPDRVTMFAPVVTKRPGRPKKVIES